SRFATSSSHCTGADISIEQTKAVAPINVRSNPSNDGINAHLLLELSVDQKHRHIVFRLIPQLTSGGRGKFILGAQFPMLQ
ncbi:MAG: hypothetical protein K2Z81_19525, partial [Cyanobacteria bacterium]|nr:hypothetical protein [Cyanobacteriota bacterium]